MLTIYNEGVPSVNRDREGTISSDQTPLEKNSIHPDVTKSHVNSPTSHRHSTSNVRNYDDSTSSTGGTTRITCPPTVVNGLDFLKVSLWFEWLSPQFFDELDRLKHIAQQGSEQSIPFHVPGNFDWNLFRTGTSQYNYRLTCGDITLLFNKRSHDGSFPTARVEIGSISCWSPGYYHIFNRVIRWLKLLDGHLKKLRISEVHLAADFIGTDINKLGIQCKDRWITKAHNFNTHEIRNDFSGITIGKNTLMLRIYDKVLELRNSECKQKVFSDVWNCKPFDSLPVTRVEFQLRRKVLNEFEGKINTTNDLVNGLQSIWNYCTQTWAKFCSKKVDRNHNQSKSQNSTFWNDVSNTNWSGTHKIERKKQRPNKNIDQLINNIAGLAMSVSAFYVNDPEDIDSIVGIQRDLVDSALYRKYKEDKHAFTTKMKRKRNEIYTNI